MIATTTIVKLQMPIDKNHNSSILFSQISLRVVGIEPTPATPAAVLANYTIHLSPRLLDMIANHICNKFQYINLCKSIYEIY